MLDSDDIKVLDKEIFSSGSYYEEAWNLVESNALFIARNLNYSYQEEKALQSFILLFFISCISIDKKPLEKLDELLKKTKIDFSHEAYEEIDLFVKNTTKNELNLKSPNELAAFMIKVSEEMLNTLYNNKSSFDEVTDNLNAFSDNFSIKLLNGENPIINLENILTEL